MKVISLGMNFLRSWLLVMVLLVPQYAAAARQSPVDGGAVTSGVGWRLDPFGSGRMVYHNGYDIAVPMGTPVYPVEAGTVYYAGTYKGYGEMVAVDHKNGYITIYGHNSQVRVKPGQNVDTSTVLALSGNSGRSTGPHVHYEVRKIPGFDKERQALLDSAVKDLVKEKIDGWVENYINGKGGGTEESLLPADLNE
jgi:murein DD-endopeptidase MepM/ murein hydrolase activator NlpD